MLGSKFDPCPACWNTWTRPSWWLHANSMPRETGHWELMNQHAPQPAQPCSCRGPAGRVACLLAPGLLWLPLAAVPQAQVFALLHGCAGRAWCLLVGPLSTSPHQHRPHCSASPCAPWGRLAPKGCHPWWQAIMEQVRPGLLVHQEHDSKQVQVALGVAPGQQSVGRRETP